METKKIYTIDTLIVVATLLVLIILVGYSTPRVIEPIEKTPASSDILFSIKKGDTLQLDTTSEFNNPKDILLSDGQVLKLNPGIYYLKISTKNLKEIRKLEIRTKVALMFIKNEDSFDLVNSGKKSLDVEVHDKNSLVDSIKINPFGGKSG